MRLTIITVLFLLILLPTKAGSEPAEPRKFYNKNFAEAPQVAGEAIKAPEIATKRDGSEEPDGGNGDSTGESEPKPSKMEKDLEAKMSAALLGQGGKIRITLYVSSKDKAHFQAVMQKAFRLAESNRSVKIAEIYHIGDYRNVSEEIKKEAAAKKIFLAPLLQVPLIASVSDSPTWVLRNAEGTHVVEGLMQIERCISSRGEYKKPERSMFIPPTPTPMSMEKF